jgi:5-methylcytosine-specific restriction endonuclease McrA
MIRAIRDLLQQKTSLLKRRSPQWPKVRAEHLAKNPRCVVCNGTKALEVHHIVPFHVDKTLELEPTNLVTMCESGKGGMNCHLSVGHLGSFKKYNLKCLESAQYINNMLKDA